jgi:thiol-disulfide isomerase/thioredoxin
MNRRTFELRGLTAIGYRLSALVLAAACIAAPSAARAQDLGIQVGAKAPGAVVQSLDGKDVDLAQYIGKTPVLIEFWATWCPNCKALEPQMLAATKKYAGKVKFLGVAVSVNQSPAKVKAYSEKHPLGYDVFFDTKGHASDVYDVPATSYIVVIDRAGKVAYTGLGSDQDIEAAIRKASP